MASDSVIPMGADSGQSADGSHVGRRRRSALWLFIGMAIMFLSLPFSGQMALAAEPGAALSGFYPESAIWYSWSSLRNGPIMIFAVLAILGSLLVFLAFHLVFGKVKIDGGRSGSTVPRWNGYERLLHWLLAGSFIALALTGLSLSFGHFVLMPIFGESGFAGYAAGALWVHNQAGLVFTAALVLSIVRWMKDSLFRSYDRQWFKQGGGYLGDRGSHPPAGKVNAGEKVYFWLGIVGLGSVMAASGLILYFVTWTESLELVAWSLIFHGLGAAAFIALVIGHIYLGAIGNEGALEGMVSGQVDTNWAKQHHDVWYDELVDKAGQSESSAKAAKASQPATTN